MHVVIAHEDESIRQALAQTVPGGDGVQISYVLPSAAVAEYAKAHPDVVILDAGDMAAARVVIDGLRALTEYELIQIIMVGKPEAMIPTRPEGPGWDGWVAVPPAPSDLADRLAAARRCFDARQLDSEFQQTLKRSRDKLKIVFDALADPIASVNADQRILSCNRAFAEHCEADFGALIGADFFEQPWVQSLGSAADSLKETVARVFESAIEERTTIASDDEQRYLDVRLIPIAEGASGIGQVTLVLADVTAIHRKSQEVLALNKRLTGAMTELNQNNAVLTETLNQLNQSQAQQLQSEKLAAIGQLAAGMAHEVNNPIGFVSSNVRTLSGYFKDLSALIERYRECARDVLASESPPDIRDLRHRMNTIAEWETGQDIDFLMSDAEELIDDCGDGLGRVEKIVRELSEFARPNDTEPGFVDLNTSLESALSILSTEGMAGIDVERDFDADAGVTATARDINQAMLQVLLNAVQAMDGDGQLGLRTRREQDHVTVRITDSGSGIPPDVLPKIFDPFFTTKPVGAGTGLGLNAVYQIITNHGGTIDVDSQLETGTAIHIRLPVQSPNDADGEAQTTE